MATLTVTELRDDLLKVYDGQRTGTIEPKDAKEINNTAGKIFSSLKVQLEYAKLRNEKPEIDFVK